MTPIGEILYGRRQTNVIVCTKLVAIKLVVTAVNVNSVAKNVRFAIGNIFIRGEIGVKACFLIIVSLRLIVTIIIKIKEKRNGKSDKM